MIYKYSNLLCTSSKPELITNNIDSDIDLIMDKTCKTVDLLHQRYVYLVTLLRTLDTDTLLTLGCHNTSVIAANGGCP